MSNRKEVDTMRIPDFFIVGASKCGTSALSEYLTEHPNVCFARTKEPHFFSDDFPLQKVDASLQDYWRRNFSYFDERKHRVIGEGSGTYYISDVAVPNILKQNPAAKFIYMIRSPLEMIYSWHYQVQFRTGETESLEEAWDSQQPRISSMEMRPEDGDLRFRQYLAVASLGQRLDYLKTIVPPEQLTVIVLDDFVSEPKAAYEKVLAFIGVPSDGRENFPQVHQSRVQRSYFLGRLSDRTPRWVVNGVRDFKHLVGLTHVPLNVFARLNSKLVKKPPLSLEFRKRMLADLEPEINLLEQHLGRDFNHWRA
jgi:hypothetical protein